MEDRGRTVSLEELLDTVNSFEGLKRIAEELGIYGIPMDESTLEDCRGYIIDSIESCRDGQE